MKIIIVDDEPLAVDNMRSLLQQVTPQAEVFGFTNPDLAYRHLAQTPVDIAFLDVEMGTTTGLELAKSCKQLCPQLNIIFVTGHSQYAIEAMQLRASGYLLKPVRIAALISELDNLRHPLLEPASKRVVLQTFGFFEIFVDGQLLKFPRTKCREALAYLVDRKGARVSYPELSAILWEDRPYDRTVQNNTQKVVSDLIKTLKDVNAQHILIKSRLDLAIDPTQVDCDYFNALRGDAKRWNAFRGEYMSNYSWAEFTIGTLVEPTQS